MLYKKLRDLETIVAAMREAIAEQSALHQDEIKAVLTQFAYDIKLEFYREFDEIIPSIMADKIDELVKKYMGE